MTATPRFEFVTRARALYGLPETIAAQHADDRDRELELWLGALLRPSVASFTSTAATGWTVTSSLGVIHPVGIAYIRIDFTRAGADITVASDGNITNTEVATVPNEYRPASEASLASVGGRVSTGYLGADGKVSLDATTTGPNILTGDTLALAGTVILA